MASPTGAIAPPATPPEEFEQNKEKEEEKQRSKTAKKPKAKGRKEKWAAIEEIGPHLCARRQIAKLDALVYALGNP